VEGQQFVAAGDMSMPRVLLVDDEPMVLRVLTRALEQAGYRVETRRNGKEALEAIRASEPNAMITDIEMPLMTGRELCEQLYREFPERQFPVFVATSLTSLEHRDWSTTIPKLTFLEKPVSARQLLKALGEHFPATVSAGG
jgi:CheY-like chemotaxis protein